MVNKYVDFVSDEDFLECIKWVCDSYPLNSEIDMEHLQRNTLDPIKQVFDISAMKIDSDSWVKNELIRQQDKTINNRIGDFHQRLLGKVEGWEDLGTGDSTKVDLRKTDNSIFMELKTTDFKLSSSELKKLKEFFVEAFQ